MKSSPSPQPRKTKYSNIIIPKIRKANDQHISLIRFRTNPPECNDEGLLIPYNIGRHVVNEEYQTPRTQPPFTPLRRAEFFFPLTPLKEWELLERQGIEVEDALLTGGEILLAQNKNWRKWICRPSPLRSVWTYS
jgi:hypothetical protein